MKQDIFKQFEELSHRDIADKKWLSKNREALLSYIKAHPTQPLVSRRMPGHRAQPMGLFSSFFVSRAMPVFIVAVIMLVSATGVTVASQDSIPGDLLYGWKVGVENIESVFIVSAQSRAQFEVNRTTKRLHEATELAVQNKADAITTQKAHAKLQEQIKIASDEISKAASENPSGALEVAVQLNATLQAHKSVLDQLTPKVDDQVKPNIQDVLSAINTTSAALDSALADLKAQAKEDLGTAKAQERIKEDAAIKIQETKEKIDAIWEVIIAMNEKSAIRISSENDIASAQDALSDAQDSYDRGAYADAIISTQSSGEIISRAEANIEATQNSGSLVKEILVTTPTPMASPTPSTTVQPTAAPSTSPTTSPTATPQTSPSASPKPTPAAKPVLTLTLNKASYLPSEAIIISIHATNTTDAPMKLTFKNGCQVDAMINAFPASSDRICTQQLSDALIQPQETYTWVLTRYAPFAIGRHTVNAELIGYGYLSANIWVQDQATPTPIATTVLTPTPTTSAPQQ